MSGMSLEDGFKLMGLLAGSGMFDAWGKAEALTDDAFTGALATMREGMENARKLAYHTEGSGGPANMDVVHAEPAAKLDA